MYSGIDELKKLAGVNEFKGYTEYSLENFSDAANANAKKMFSISSQPSMYTTQHLFELCIT